MRFDQERTSTHTYKLTRPSIHTSNSSLFCLAFSSQQSPTCNGPWLVLLCLFLGLVSVYRIAKKKAKSEGGEEKKKQICELIFFIFSIFWLSPSLILWQLLGIYTYPMWLNLRISALLSHRLDPRWFFEHQFQGISVKMVMITITTIMLVGSRCDGISGGRQSPRDGDSDDDRCSHPLPLRAIIFCFFFVVENAQASPKHV